MKKILVFVTVLMCMLFFKNNVYAYKEYKVGDLIKYRDEYYFVIEDSDENINYVTLLKDKALTVDELYKYGRDESDNLFINEYIYNNDNPEKIVYEDENGNGNIAFYTSETCRYDYQWYISNFAKYDFITDGCTNDYDKSDVKKVVDNWSNSFSDDLVEVRGYKARLLTTKELMDQLGFGNQLLPADTFEHSDITPSCVYDQPFAYWIISSDNIDNDDQNFISPNFNYGFYSLNTSLHFGDIHSNYVTSMFAVRPVINLDKCVLNESECHSCSEEINYIYKTKSQYNSYKIGDEVNYNGQSYYVIRRSDSSTEYVVLLKKEIFTSDEISRYSNGLYNEERVPYYVSDLCNSQDNKSGCIISPEQSNPMIIIKNWAKDNVNENDLVNIDGHTIRLLTTDELVNYLSFHYYSVTNYKGFEPSGSVGWLCDVQYWIDGPDEDDMTSAYIADYETVSHYIFEKSGIRPVININKCAIDGGCYEEEYQIEKCIEDDNNLNDDNKVKVLNDNKTVTVENTLKTVSVVILIISLLLIIVGTIILLAIHNKSKKKIKK